MLSSLVCIRNNCESPANGFGERKKRLLRREENVGTSEDSLKELTKLTVESVQINNAMLKLLPRPANVSSGESTTTFVITEDLIAKYEELEKRRDDVERKRREVWIKYKNS
jgi:hypothetical protein